MDAIRELDRKGLREFGLVTGAIFMALFGVFFPWILGAATPLWPWLVGGILGIWALAAPSTLRLPYRLWMRLALALNRVTTPIIMAIVFGLVITPVALVMRLLGHDPMARGFKRGARSYRVESRKASKQHMERPF